VPGAGVFTIAPKGRVTADGSVEFRANAGAKWGRNISGTPGNNPTVFQARVRSTAKAEKPDIAANGIATIRAEGNSAGPIVQVTVRWSGSASEGWTGSIAAADIGTLEQVFVDQADVDDVAGLLGNAGALLMALDPPETRNERAVAAALAEANKHIRAGMTLTAGEITLRDGGWFVPVTISKGLAASKTVTLEVRVP
jgi:hypothetical protein